MPEKGKKADLMFVQHMLAVLKADGKMATIMPHGVLFRGGEEKEARKHFIEHGWLEAVIGLPAGLFYGTGIPACVLVMNKKDAASREARLLHQCRPRIPRGQGAELPAPRGHLEDRPRLSTTEDVPGYARRVPVSEIDAEDYNCNIRRYVDNAPPPEPHDVRAHLHGGVPVVEIDALARFWNNYPGLRERVCPGARRPVPAGTTADRARMHSSRVSLVRVSRRKTPHFTRTSPRTSPTAATSPPSSRPIPPSPPPTPVLATLASGGAKPPARHRPRPGGGKKGNVYELRRLLLASIATRSRTRPCSPTTRSAAHSPATSSSSSPTSNPSPSPAGARNSSRTTTSSKASSPRSSPI